MSAELILHNAKIVTNGVPSFVEAIAITAGRISAAGKVEEEHVAELWGGSQYPQIRVVAGLEGMVQRRGGEVRVIVQVFGGDVSFETDQGAISLLRATVEVERAIRLIPC